MSQFSILALVLMVLGFRCTGAWADYHTKDTFIPYECDRVVGLGDHVLLEYRAYFANGTLTTSHTKPSILLHAHVTTQEDLPILQSLKGMCKNATRRVIWNDGNKLNTLPIFLNSDAGFQGSGQGVYIDITVDQITTAEEYEVFAALRIGNYSQVLDSIENHIGVNAVDEWGHTPLMIAVQINRIDIVAALLNTRLPRVDINAAKPVCLCFSLFFDFAAVIFLIFQLD
jgi:hypothetical protein